jgi:hypothetical protein
LRVLTLAEILAEQEWIEHGRGMFSRRGKVE